MIVSIKACVQKPRKDGMFQVYIRITKDRKIGYLKTPWVVNSKGLTKEKEIKDSFVMGNVSRVIASYYDKLNKVDITNWTYKEIVDYLNNATEDISFSEIAWKYHAKMINEGRERSSDNYKFAILSLQKFCGTEDIMFSRLTAALLQRWIDTALARYARAKELYPICIRQIFKYAMSIYNDEERSIIRIHNPWVKVTIPEPDIPDKRALDATTLRKFFSVIPRETRNKYPLGEFSQDMSKLMLCLAGINTCDLFNLKKTDYYDGIIHYFRAKTQSARSDRAYFEIRVPVMITYLINKYIDKTDSEWLFNFHQRMSTSDSFNANVNKGIKEICEQAGIQKFSCYGLRHSWATIAQNACGASMADVDFGLNHSSHKMAKVYIKIDFAPVWELNEKVLEFVFFSDKELKVIEDQEKDIKDFSQHDMMSVTAFHQGKVIAKLEDSGFSCIDDIFERVSKVLPDDIPEKAMIQYKIENKAKKVVQYYEKKK